MNKRMIGCAMVVALAAGFTSCGDDDGPGSTCGDAVCQPDETIDTCYKDCGPRCGDGVLDEPEGEECDGDDFGGLTCADPPVNCPGGTLTCRNDCTISIEYCTACLPIPATGR